MHRRRSPLSSSHSCLSPDRPASSPPFAHLPPVSTHPALSLPPSLSLSSPSPTSTSPPTPSSPLLLSPTSLSSVVELKRRYDSLLLSHSALSSSVASLTASAASSHARHCADEADWRQRCDATRADYEAVLRDLAQEGEGRRRAEVEAERLRTEVGEREEEGKRRERLLALTQADVDNERRLVAHLRAQVAHAQRAGEGEGKGELERGVEGAHAAQLFDVQAEVLKRRVQRLQEELEGSRLEVEALQAVRRRQAEVLEEVQLHLQALVSVRKEGQGALDEVDGREAEQATALELELMRERVLQERRLHWQSERRLYCLALLWLCGFFAAAMAGLALF